MVSAQSAERHLRDRVHNESLNLPLRAERYGPRARRDGADPRESILPATRERVADTYTDRVSQCCYV